MTGIFSMAHRMDWGFGNPNKTAALIVMLMISVWVLAYMRRWMFWISLPLFWGLGFCLLATASRGGLVACIAGLTVLLWYSQRPWPKAKIIGSVLAGIALVTLATQMKVGDRIEQGVITEDQSIYHRWLIWRETPRMMVDAPSGWGLGNSGNAYMQWYQPLDHHEGYRTLVSSHLTWLVELGWPARFAYVFGWAIVLLLCWPADNRRWVAVPFAMWLSFLITAGFSSIAESFWLWILPGISLLLAIIARLLRKTWPSPRTLIGVIIGAIMLLAIIFCTGSIPQKQKIYFSSNRVTIGKESPTTWIIPDTAVFGDDYGKTLRQWLDEQKSSGAIGVALKVKNLPSDKGITLVTGGQMIGVSELRSIGKENIKLILLNPLRYPQELGVTKQNGGAFAVFFGEYSESPALSSWRQTSPTVILTGAGDYLPQWAKILNAK